MDKDKILQDFLAIIKANTNEVSYNIWFTPLSIRDINEDAEIIYMQLEDGTILKLIKFLYMHLIETNFDKFLVNKYRIIIKTGE